MGANRFCSSGRRISTISATLMPGRELLEIIGTVGTVFNRDCRRALRRFSRNRLCRGGGLVSKSVRFLFKVVRRIEDQSRYAGKLAIGGSQSQNTQAPADSCQQSVVRQETHG